MTIYLHIFKVLDHPMALIRGRDGEFEVEDANCAFEQLVGLSLDYMRSRKCAALEAFQLNLSRRTLKSEIVIRTKHRPDLFVRVEQIPLPDMGDGWGRALVMAEDLTSDNWILSKHDQGNVMISGIMDNHLHIRFLRDSLAPFIFKPDRKLEDETLMQFIADSEHQQLMELFASSTHSDEERRIKLRTNKKSGVELDLELTFKPISDGYGKPKEYAFVIWDIQPVDSSIDSAMKLKIWMAKRDVSPGQLSAATGISLQTISKLRNGKIEKPQRLTAELIASELQVDVHEIWPSIRK